MKTRLTTLVAAGALGALGASLASGGTSPITGGIVGSGVMTYGTATVHLSAENGFVMEWARLAPGASFGWHFHQRPVIVAVKAGTLTLYDSKDPSCRATRYTAGKGFVEPANHVHVARNEGTRPVLLYATYLAVPGTWRDNPTPLDKFVKNPGNCPASVR